MKTLKTKQIDGFQIITGFQIRPIDPEETKKQSAAKILVTDEITELKKKQEEQNRNVTRFKEARKKGKYHLRLAYEGKDIVKNKESVKKQDKISNDLLGVINICNEDLKPLVLAGIEKTKDILRSNPVFFGARKNEVIKTELEITDLLAKFAGKTENQELLEDGSYIDDFRGKVYHKKTGDTWTETLIGVLGVKKSTGSKYTGELTDQDKTEIAEQNETERINGLTSEQKTAEYDLRSESLLSESFVMRSKLEIQGISTEDALTQSSNFYNAELDKLKTKYGVV